MQASRHKRSGSGKQGMQFACSVPAFCVFRPDAHHMKSRAVMLLTEPGVVSLPCFQYSVIMMRLTSSLSADRGPMNFGSRKSRADRYCAGIKQRQISDQFREWTSARRFEATARH